MGRILLLILFFSIFHTGFTQKLGDDAYYVKQLVEIEMRNYYNAQGYNQVSQDYKVLYNNGMITEVVLQKENVPDVFFRRPVSFRIRYIMNSGLLNKVMKEFFDISVDELKKSSKDLHRGNIIDEYLFNGDYTIYSKVYIGKTGQATIETKHTVVSDFPTYLQRIIEKDLAEAKNTSNKVVTENNDARIGKSREEVLEVEKGAEFFGDRDSILSYINRSFKYPTSIQQYKIGGRVGLLFTVEKDGKISDVKVIRANLDSGLLEELRRVVLNMPKWKPASFNNQALASKQELDLTFILPIPENKSKAIIEFTKKTKAIMSKRKVSKS